MFTLKGLTLEWGKQQTDFSWEVSATIGVNTKGRGSRGGAKLGWFRGRGTYVAAQGPTLGFCCPVLTFLIVFKQRLLHFHFAWNTAIYVVGLGGGVVLGAACPFYAVLPSCPRTMGSHPFLRPFLGEGPRQHFLCVPKVPGTVPAKIPSSTSSSDPTLGCSQRWIWHSLCLRGSSRARSWRPVYI